MGMQAIVDKMGRQGQVMVTAFYSMEVAEESIRRYATTFPGMIPTLWDTFLTCYQTWGSNEAVAMEIYEARVSELLMRVVHGDDLTLATDAEIMVGISQASFPSPLTREATALYWNLFKQIMPPEDVQSVRAHHEDMDAFREEWPGQLDETLAWARKKGRVSDRHIPNPERWYSVKVDVREKFLNDVGISIPSGMVSLDLISASPPKQLSLF